MIITFTTLNLYKQTYQNFLAAIQRFEHREVQEFKILIYNLQDLDNKILANAIKCQFTTFLKKN